MENPMLSFEIKSVNKDYLMNIISICAVRAEECEIFASEISTYREPYETGPSGYQLDLEVSAPINVLIDVLKKVNDSRQ